VMISISDIGTCSGICLSVRSKRGPVHFHGLQPNHCHAMAYWLHHANPEIERGRVNPTMGLSQKWGGALGSGHFDIKSIAQSIFL
jgi:hypothetical protein